MHITSDLAHTAELRYSKTLPQILRGRQMAETGFELLTFRFPACSLKQLFNFAPLNLVREMRQVAEAPYQVQKPRPVPQ